MMALTVEMDGETKAGPKIANITREKNFRKISSW